VSWPMVGTPRELFVDNAAEFHAFDVTCLPWFAGTGLAHLLA